MSCGSERLARGTLLQRAVPAMLVLEAPRVVVSVDRRIGDLWADEPPARAMASVQAYTQAASRHRRRVGAPEAHPARLLC
jgi:DNA-binding SARP family transcriptional activator